MSPFSEWRVYPLRPKELYRNRLRCQLQYVKVFIFLCIVVQNKSKFYDRPLKWLSFWTRFFVFEIQVPNKNAVQISEDKIQAVQAHKVSAVYARSSTTMVPGSIGLTDSIYHKLKEGPIFSRIYLGQE